MTPNDETFTLMTGRQIADEVTRSTKGPGRAKAILLAQSFKVCDRQRADHAQLIADLKQLLVRACDNLETESLDECAAEIRKAAGL